MVSETGTDKLVPTTESREEDAVVTTDVPGATDANSIEGVDEALTKPVRPRNYSFSHKNPDTLDSVETKIGSFTIPAAIGSTYWAILKVFYEHPDERIFIDALLAGVEELMKDRDADGWSRYCTKDQTTVYKKAEGKRSVQKIKPWQDRIVGNAKTLTRQGGNSPYGKRLHERGHALKFTHDANGQPYFVLHTQPLTKDQ